MEDVKRQLVGQRLSAARSRAAVLSAVDQNSKIVMKYVDDVNDSGMLRGGSELVVRAVLIEPNSSLRCGSE